MENNQRPGISWNKLDSCEWGTKVGESGRAYIPHACMQCEKPACVSVCPTAASYKREDGITMVDYEKCIACGFCMSACPYNARKLNNVDENMFGSYSPAPYEAYGVQRELVVEKCIFCEGRLAEGRLPSCVVNCPGRARYFGDLEDQDSSIAQFISNNESVRIDETSFYYMPVAGMPLEALPFATGSASSERKQASPGIDPVVVGVGGAGIVAVGAAIGITVHNRNKKRGGE
jgi:molybdopterin-containing oxidoreductase family iron-sulfur binding subunit